MSAVVATPFSPLPFVLVETCGTQHGAQDGGECFFRLRELLVNFLLFMVRLSLCLALPFTFLPVLGIHFGGYKRHHTAADIARNHPPPFAAFFVEIEPA
jgi:hypothetical protein